MLAHNDMVNYYHNVFKMVQHHGYRIEEVENMVVYELDIYNTLIGQWLKDKELIERSQQ